MTTKENLPSVWVVNAIGGSVYHVMTLAEDEGASEIALCRKIIPLKQRAGPAHWRSQLKVTNAARDASSSPGMERMSVRPGIEEPGKPRFKGSGISGI